MDLILGMHCVSACDRHRAGPLVVTLPALLAHVRGPQAVPINPMHLAPLRTAAYRYLRAAGHATVFVLEGGVAAWQAQGYGVEQ